MTRSSGNSRPSTTLDWTADSVGKEPITTAFLEDVGRILGAFSRGRKGQTLYPFYV
jgi:hypothetical protein